MASDEFFSDSAIHSFKVEISSLELDKLRRDALRQLLDVDNFASFLAVGMLIAQHDSYALNQNNYRLYRDPESGRFTMIAHGVDGSFTQNAIPIMPSPNRILTRAILEPFDGQQLYRERVMNLFTNIFKLEVMTNRIHAVATRLHAAAINDEERASVTRRAERFIRRVIERHDNVSKQIAGLQDSR